MGYQSNRTSPDTERRVASTVTKRRFPNLSDTDFGKIFTGPVPPPDFRARTWCGSTEVIHRKRISPQRDSLTRPKAGHTHAEALQGIVLQRADAAGHLDRAGVPLEKNLALRFVFQVESRGCEATE